MSVFHHFVLEAKGAALLNTAPETGFFATRPGPNATHSWLATSAKWHPSTRKALKKHDLSWVQPTYHRPARGMFVSRHAPRSPPA